MSDLPNPDTLERQPGAPSAGADNFNADVIVTPEDAAAEAKAAQAALKQEQDAARAARRERDEALARESAAVQREFSSREQTLAATIQAQENIVAQAKRAIADAQANGDPVAMTDAIEALSDAKASLKMLGEHKINLEGQKGRQPEQQRSVDNGMVRVRTPGGEIEVAPHAKQWMDNHTRFYNDKTYYNHAVTAHRDIIDDGYKDGSPAYFRELDARMQKFEQFEAFERGEHTPPAKDNHMNGNNTRRMPAAAMGAPVSRQPAQNNHNRSGAPDAATIARHLGCDVGDLRDFARINGYTKDRYKGDENAAFNAYLASHQEIIDIQRSGGDAGMRVDGVYR